MKIYLGGPMQGYSEFNFPAFDAAAAELRAMGHVVFSPADNDRERFGKYEKNEQGDPRKVAAEQGMSELQMRRLLFMDDFTFIIQEAEAICLLTGWEASKGARAESAAAIAIGLRRFVATDDGRWLEVNDVGGIIPSQLAA